MQGALRDAGHLGDLAEGEVAVEARAGELEGGADNAAQRFSAARLTGLVGQFGHAHRGHLSSL